MAKKNVSVWTSIPFWRRSAAWVTGFASILLIWLTFDTLGQISMGTDEDLTNKVTKRIPAPTVINYHIDYKYDKKRGSEVPVIGAEEPFFGKKWSPEEAAELLHLGKLTSQAKNCMNCHTLLGNGAYYAPDLTKAWLDPNWEAMGFFGKPTKEEGIAHFLQHPSENGIHTRRMPNLGITEKEAQGLVAFLKHMSSIDTNGFPRNFSKTTDQFKAGGTNAR
ncbi:Nitric-oxide reductase subunit C [hydrothermal vent metagenome]|uniref:Nitric-oxide reductase subunit C n=1 Tax=hydrothermal vent metagenome TaxID=652676 RepID=A0A1W1BQA3_9ZZZZ